MNSIASNLDEKEIHAQLNELERLINEVQTIDQSATKNNAQSLSWHQGRTDQNQGRNVIKGIKLKFTGGVDGGRGWKGDFKNMLLDNKQNQKLG